MSAYPEPAELQALLLGLLRRPFSRHLLFRFGRSARRSRRLLAGIPVTIGDSAPIPLTEPLTSVGITHRGLHGLGIEHELIHRFDPRFLDGVASKRMGDHPSTPSAIKHWWERRFKTESVHLIVHIHALEPAQLEQRTRAIRTLAEACYARELIPRKDGTTLDGAFMSGPGKLHFGYTDGISAPHIAWHGPPGPGEVDAREFVLGYSCDEYFSAPEDGPAAELARGSTYGAFRWVYQDVAAFNLLLREEGPRVFGELGAEAAEELLAAKLLGRWRDGTPLVLSPDRPDPAYAASDDFEFAEADPDGLRCPFSAHIRVMNPRGSALKPAAGTTPKVLRRGTPYGPPLEGTVDDGVDRGLLGVFLCRDINKQILKLPAWAQENNFARVYRGAERVQDALVGNRAGRADTSFRIPREDGPAVIAELPAFLRTKGTALALYPGRETLRRLTA
jgi:deferrochelatase/peroxidase EfeB